MIKMMSGVLIVLLFLCASHEVRTPAQSDVLLKQNMLFVDLSSYVKVPSPHLTKKELAHYQNQCHIQMVDKLLNFSTRLQKIKNYSKKNTQVGPLRLTKLDSVTSKFAYTSWNFKFTVNDENGVVYHGYIYTETNKNLPLIRQHHDGTYEYQCWDAQDGWIFDAAVLKDSRGQLIFSSSCAQQMLNGKNIDERCEVL